MSRPYLEDVRNHLVWNPTAVLVPILAVLLATLGVITEGAVCQQDQQPDGIRVGHHVFEPGRYRPEERQ